VAGGVWLGGARAAKILEGASNGGEGGEVKL
jgi:hypothetical protein